MIELTFEEFGKHRKSNGYINLDEIITDGVELEREVRGNEERDKNWFDIKDGRVMFKANANNRKYSQYSELICCELAKQAGIEPAQYDFAEHKGEIGVITKDIRKNGEEMISINELIGHGPTNPEYVDKVDIIFVFNKLEEKLRLDGYDENDIDLCMLQLRKQLLYDIYVMETDRHTENVSCIISKDAKTGKPDIRIAAMYDTEDALVLYDDDEMINGISDSMVMTANITDMQEPKMCVIPEKEDKEQNAIGLTLLEQLQLQVGESYATESEEIWKTTLDFLIEDRRAYAYLEETLSCMDIKKAIEEVEQTKKCNIPDAVKNMAIACFEDRKNAIAYELGLDIEYNYKKEISAEELT